MIIGTSRRAIAGMSATGALRPSECLARGDRLPLRTSRFGFSESCPSNGTCRYLRSLQRAAVVPTAGIHPPWPVLFSGPNDIRVPQVLAALLLRRAGLWIAQRGRHHEMATGCIIGERCDCAAERHGDGAPL